MVKRLLPISLLVLLAPTALIAERVYNSNQDSLRDAQRPLRLTSSVDDAEISALQASLRTKLNELLEISFVPWRQPWGSFCLTEDRVRSPVGLADVENKTPLKNQQIECSPGASVRPMSQL